MGVIKKLISSAKASVMDTKFSEWPERDELEMLFNVSNTEATDDDKRAIIDKWHVFHESHGDVGANVSLGLQIGAEAAASGLVVAFQVLVVASDVTDLTTLSQTPHTFDWRDAGRTSIILLPHGAGVRNYPLLYDLVLDDPHTQQGMVWGKAANTLQLVKWDGSAFQTHTFDGGWELTLIQFIPAMLEVLD